MIEDRPPLEATGGVDGWKPDQAPLLSPGRHILMEEEVITPPRGGRPTIENQGLPPRGGASGPWASGFTTRGTSSTYIFKGYQPRNQKLISMYEYEYILCDFHKSGDIDFTFYPIFQKKKTLAIKKSGWADLRCATYIVKKQTHTQTDKQTAVTTKNRMYEVDTWGHTITLYDIFWS